jgi:hypothetical protein
LRLSKEIEMKRMTMFAVVACLISTAGPDMAVAVANGTARCHDVDADFTSQLTTEGCTSPLGLCASGTIKHDPLIKGPMFVTINNAAPSAGMPEIEPPSVLSVSGERNLTPLRGGTLSLHVIGIGIFGTSLEMFDELNIITKGTGRFRGATGTLHVAGRATSSTTFAGEMTGRICVP